MKIYREYEKTPQILGEQDTVRVTIIGDAHGGSRYAILPPDIETYDGTKLLQSRIQKTIWKGYLKSLDKIGETDVIIVGGDMAEGKQIKAAGVGLEDGNTDTHVDIGSRVVQEACTRLNPKAVIGITGTPYHISYGVGGNLDYQVLTNVNHDNIYFGNTVNIKIGKSKTLWNIQHKISIANVNRLMPAEKIYRFYYRDHASGRIDEIPDVIVRFHMHLMQPPTPIDGYRYFIRGGCLKAKDEYIGSLSYPSNPDIGVLETHQTDGLLEYSRFHRIKVK